MGEISGDTIEKHCSKFLCPICKDPLSVPQSIIKCKHTFCYSCLKNWFINSIKNSNLRCPLCRVIVEDEPFNNKILQSVIISFYTLFFDKEGEDGQQQTYFQRLGPEKKEFELDLKNKNLFEESFRSTGVGIVDMDDGGVLRCSSCHWEIENAGNEEEDQTECPHCGVAFRGVDRDEVRRIRREAGNESEDDGESINTEGERSDMGMDSENENDDENSDLDGFIIDELGESENGSESDSSLNSDYYEFNSDNDDAEKTSPVKKRKRRNKRVTVDISDDESGLSDSDDIIIIEKKDSYERKDKKDDITSKKRKTVIIDDEEE
ncbi:hypothetical protein QEN19_003711 [Hanseniaspora menglaensis]